MTQRVVNYTYGTNNPVLPNGSVDVKDGIDNLQSFDVFMNAEEDTYNQRDGEIVKTRSGAVRAVGIQRIGDFTSGCDVTERNQGVLSEADGTVYVWLGSLPKFVPASSSPATTGGIGPSGWLDVGDASARSALSANSGAGDVGTSDGSTVQDKLDESDAAQLLGNKIPETYGNQDAAVLISRRQKRTDNHVWFLGDSHSWGEGAPEYTAISAIESYSVHSSPLGNRGFVAQAIDRINSVRGWAPGTYLSANFQLGGKPMTGDYSEGFDGGDPELTKSMSLRAGAISATAVDLAATRTKACDKFYRPFALGDTYSALAYRDKVAVGRFAKSLMVLKHETVNTFAHDNKKHFARLPVNASYAPGAVGFTEVLGDGGAVIAKRQTSSGITYLVSTPGYVLPHWARVGFNIVVPGYGLAKIQLQLGTGEIEIRNIDGNVPSADFMKYCHQGMMIFPGTYLEKAFVSVDFSSHHSRAYIAVRTGAAYGKMRVYFTDGIQTGGLADPFFSLAAAQKKANTYSSTNPSPQLMLVYSMGQDGSFNASDASVTIGSSYVEIECNTVTDEEVVYAIDFGGKATGRLFIESVEPLKQVGLRGVVFDNNLAVNYAMGGHTVGAWLGDVASGSGETRDHIGDLLAYTPVRPSSVIVQIPFVNEYLNQTPITIFTTRLQTLVNRINAHMPSGQNQLGTAFLFYTTLRNREVAFAGAAESAITYDMYVSAAKSFCTTSGYEFIDIEDKLLQIPSKIGIPYQRLFLNSNHPSDFANMLIADELCFHVMSIG